MLPSFDYARPKSMPEVFKHLSSKGARVQAGGTDLYGCLRDSVFEASMLVSLRNINELRGIAEQRGWGSHRRAHDRHRGSCKSDHT